MALGPSYNLPKIYGKLYSTKKIKRQGQIYLTKNLNLEARL